MLSLVIIAASTNDLKFVNAGDWVGSIDNVSIVEIRDDLIIGSVTAKKQGALWSGTSDYISAGIDMIGTKACTVVFAIHPLNWGGLDNGVIIDNGELSLYNNKSTNRLFFKSNSSSSCYSNTIDGYLNKTWIVFVDREEDGTTNFYMADKNNAPTLNGGVDLSSGTPVAGTTSIVLGNKSTLSNTFDGFIKKGLVTEGIIDLDAKTQIWSEWHKEVFK